NPKCALTHVYLQNYVFAWIRWSSKRLDRGGLSVEPGELPGAHEDPEKHRAVELAGVRVAKRGMVAAEQCEAVGELVLGSMAEDEGRPALNDAGANEVGEVAVPGDLAEAD